MTTTARLQQDTTRKTKSLVHEPRSKVTMWKVDGGKKMKTRDFPGQGESNVGTVSQTVDPIANLAIVRQ